MLNGCHGKTWGLQSNGDVWQRIEAAMHAKGLHACRITKVNGHATREHIEAGLTTERDRAEARICGCTPTSVGGAGELERALIKWRPRDWCVRGTVQPRRPQPRSRIHAASTPRTHTLAPTNVPAACCGRPHFRSLPPRLCLPCALAAAIPCLQASLGPANSSRPCSRAAQADAETEAEMPEAKT